MNYKIIASGSKGNALAICEGSIKMLIDCGVSYKSVRSLRPDFIFLTHEHADHMRIRTIKSVLDDCPLCKLVIGPHLYQKLTDAGISPRRIISFEAGARMLFSKQKTSMVASYFELEHDVPNIGWKLSLESTKTGGKAISLMYATDTASIDHISLPDLDYYFLEANYEDEELEERMAEKLRHGEYSYEARVRLSHLSKAQADKWLANNAGENSRFIYMHQHTNR